MSHLRIWKYPLDFPGEDMLELPPHKVLSVQFQGNTLTLWALVDTRPDRPGSGLRRFRVVGTGQDLPWDLAAWEYVTTVQHRLGEVWHVFMEPR